MADAIVACLQQRAFACVTGVLLLLALAGCGGSGGHESHRSPAAAGAAWSVSVPRRWHTNRFNDSTGRVVSAGIQISNVQLPRPHVVPGYPIQVNGRVLPADGIALIVATDDDPSLHLGHVAALPLASLDRSRVWTFGSALAGSPYIETVRFRAGGRTYVASAKIGAHVTRGDLGAMNAVVQSLRLSETQR